MDLTKCTKDELIKLCKDNNIKGFSGKNKSILIELIKSNTSNASNASNTSNTSTIVNTNTLKLVDLFSGTGAFTLGFENTKKVKCVFANDMVDWSKKIYDFNFDHKLTLQDLNDINVANIPSHDILTGGFPCQPFSIAGKQEGFNDTRSNVFWKILSIIDHHKPCCVILENVKNLISHDDKKTFKTIQKNLTERGYHIHYKL